MAEDRRQMAEQKRQKTEDRSQKTEICSLFSVLCPLSSVLCSLSSFLCSLAFVVLAVTAAGCAVCEKSTIDTRCVPAVRLAGSPAGGQARLPRGLSGGQGSILDEPKPIKDELGKNQESRIENRDEDFDLLEEKDFKSLEEELGEQAVKVADPLEPLNRIMYNVNDKLYFWAAKPITQAYKDVVPEPARVGIRNFFHNLITPIRLANCLLQGKGDSANAELRRFVVNTTEGVLGFGDPARDKRGLEPVEEDLGQTLAVHGIGNGFYVVWPLFGPSTMRDSVGFVGDLFLNPVSYVRPLETSVAISAGKMMNENSFLIGQYEDFKAAALEPYVAMRQAYIQYRNKQIQE
jgi:phospholipid-binding lipoprotein MlaA